MGGGKGGGGGGNQTVTQKADPWSGIQPYLLRAAQDTNNLYGQGLLTPRVYQGQTYAGFSPESMQAMGLTTSRAINGSPINNANKGMLSDTLSGKYLDPESNPYLKATFDKAAGQVTSKVNSTFGGAGRYGSGINQQILGRELGSTANDIYGKNFEQERQRQMAASALAPQAANQDYTDLGALANVGSQREGMAQNEINDVMNRFNANASAPGQAIENYIGLLNGTGGRYGSTQQTTPYHQNSGMGALGQGLGLLGGLGGMSGAMTGLPWLSGAGLGSQLGGLGKAAMSMFSDRRLKENIRYLGIDKGIPIYSFSYVFDKDHKKYRGVMAQDLFWTHPEAVDMEGDYYTVDYGKIGIEFAELH
jgi:hypothetical protein